MITSPVRVVTRIVRSPSPTVIRTRTTRIITSPEPVTSYTTYTTPTYLPTSSSYYLSSYVPTTSYYLSPTSSSYLYSPSLVRALSPVRASSVTSNYPKRLPVGYGSRVLNDYLSSEPYTVSVCLSVCLSCIELVLFMDIENLCTFVHLYL